MRIAIGQINAVVGDLAGNAEKMKSFYYKAKDAGADLLVFPELAICGYPPEDLLLKKHFLQENLQTVKKLAKELKDITVVTGFADSPKGKSYNAAAILQKGAISRVYHKTLLPNFGVFDEQRYFNSGDKVVTFKSSDGLKIAVTICRDIWDIKWLSLFLKDTGKIDLIINISASPFHIEKIEHRKDVLKKAAKKFKCAVVYCNLIGGQDEIVFDGRSMVIDSNGKTALIGKAFDEDMPIADIVKDKNKIKIVPVTMSSEQPKDDIEEIYKALVLGTKDYARKNGFKKFLLGLSGGIDSSVVAAIAAAAVGAENVIGITMPSRFSSTETRDDAYKLAKNLGIHFYSIPIETVLGNFDKELGAVDGWNNKGIAYENLQARIRGTMLMSLSNQFGALVLTTGNKSETAVGYSTLYGDTAGGFAVIKDVYKTLVYKLSRHINKVWGKDIIPESVFTRPPTAELRDNQKDSDSLPEYEMLDKILEGYIENDKSAEQLAAEKLPKAVVEKVIRMVDLNEYKRRQSPPGVKITSKAFGKDRRFPITNRYKG